MANRNIQISSLTHSSTEDESIEIVERKGIGHPDSICDGIAESVSRSLCQCYLESFGKILHHNTDEAQLVAGNSIKKFGGGEILKPIEIIVVGRATTTYQGVSIPVIDIATKATKDYLRDVIPELNLESGVKLSVKFGEGSGALQNIFGSFGNVPLSNDTSFGVGHAPFSETETIVLNVERELNTNFHMAQPAIGPDIKVMGLREHDKIQLTIAAALIDRYVTDMDHYQDILHQIHESVYELTRKYTEKDLTIFVNSADVYDDPSNINNIYLTVTGTSAEHGDDGSVGRGNRANGLITPNRPMSMEATSGKNPVNHVGKIYNLLSNDVANKIINSFPPTRIKDVSIRVLSQISAPIDQPHIADIKVVTNDGNPLTEAEKSQIFDIVDYNLDTIHTITDRVVSGELHTF